MVAEVESSDVTAVVVVEVESAAGFVTDFGVVVFAVEGSVSS